VIFEVTKNQSHFKSRTMRKVKQLRFDGETIYIGLDVHKNNWKVNSRLKDVDLLSFSQDPDAKALGRYFRKNYPGAKISVVYEAGFCGFGIQRSLTEQEINCIVVNAADVPCSDKERKRKDDKRDARKLSRELAEGNLKGIYIPDIEKEQARALSRQRFRLVQDQTRCKNRIKHLLMFNGLQGVQRWSMRYVKELETIQCRTPALKTALSLAIEEYKQIRAIVKQATVSIRQLAQQPPFAAVQQYLQSIDGIGLINGMVIQTEVQCIHRFRTLDSLCDYAGFVPDINSSDEKMIVKGITRRCNEFLRKAIVESSWMLIRKDLAMLMKYNQYRRRMDENKAIIRIGKHLLARIRYVWNNQTVYKRNTDG
jgi:transposase